MELWNTWSIFLKKLMAYQKIQDDGKIARKLKGKPVELIWSKEQGKRLKKISWASRSCVTIAGPLDEIGVEGEEGEGDWKNTAEEMMAANFPTWWKAHPFLDVFLGEAKKSPP